MTPNPRSNKRKTKEGCTSILLRDVPKALRDFYRATCVRRGVNMTDDLIEYMRKRVKEERKAFLGDKENEQ